MVSVHNLDKTIKVDKFGLRGYIRKAGRARTTTPRPRHHTRVRAVWCEAVGAALTARLACRRYPFMPGAGTVKRTGLGRHGFGRKHQNKQSHHKGENGKQAAARLAAATSAPATMSDSTARRTRSPKPAASSSARRRELKTDAASITHRNWKRKWRVKTGGRAAKPATAPRNVPKPVKKRRSRFGSSGCRRACGHRHDRRGQALPRTERWAHVTGAVQMAEDDEEHTMSELRDR